MTRRDEDHPGQTLAMEGLFAFFLEFDGSLSLYGRSLARTESPPTANRGRPRSLVALRHTIVANDFMQH